MPTTRKEMTWIYLACTVIIVVIGATGIIPVAIAVPQAVVLAGLTVFKFFAAYGGRKRLDAAKDRKRELAKAAREQRVGK